MTTFETSPVSFPAQLAGFTVDRVLTENQSWVAMGPGGRQVVLKRLDPDCMLGDSLHPSVRDRLSRIRELAHCSVANLFGVERDSAGGLLMWEYVVGEPFDRFVAGGHTPREIAAAGRELVLAVDLLHMQGIVHGALIASNVIVSGASVVRLTHVSPLLYTDPAVDLECVWNLLELAAEGLGPAGSGLAAIVADARLKKLSLRQLASRLGTLIDTRESRRLASTHAPVSSIPRLRALVGAAVVAMLGLAIAWSVRHVISNGQFEAASPSANPALSDR